jgi:hypothetical protein
MLLYYFLFFVSTFLESSDDQAMSHKPPSPIPSPNTGIFVTTVPNSIVTVYFNFLLILQGLIKN